MTVDRKKPETIRLTEADFDGYSAAPLLLTGIEEDPVIVARQDTLISNFDAVTHQELSGIVRPRIVNFVAHSITSRMQERGGLNSISYQHRAYRRPQAGRVPNASRKTVKEACANARIGEGTIFQNGIAFRAFGMQKGELANLTVVGDFRHDLVQPMWDEVSDYVGHDATPSDPEEYYRHQVLGVDLDPKTNSHSGAIRFGMKRALGTSILGGEVKVRTTMVIDTRPSSSFDQDTVDRLMTAERNNSPLSSNAVAWLLEKELPHCYVLARNDTVYEVISAEGS